MMPKNDQPRGFRLDDETLLDYACGMLEGPIADHVAAALRDQPRLSERVAHMQAILETLRTDDSVAATDEAIRLGLEVWTHLGQRQRAHGAALVARARRCIAELVFDSRRPLALAGYRRSSATTTPDAPGTYRLTYTSPAGLVDLQFTDRGQRWRLRGQVEAAEPTRVDSVTLLPVESGEVVESLPDAHGGFRVDALPGRYDLLIELDQGLHAILAQDLLIGI